MRVGCMPLFGGILVGVTPAHLNHVAIGISLLRWLIVLVRPLITTKQFYYFRFTHASGIGIMQMFIDLPSVESIAD